jgi:hypothetical protein
MQEEEYKYNQYIEARLCAVIYNAHGVTKEDSDEPFTAEDFLPENIENIPPELQEELDELKMRRVCKAMGGKEIIYQ